MPFFSSASAVVPSCLLVLGLSFLMCAGLSAADAWDTAKARHTWTWFALSEAQAGEEARRQGGTLVIERRDGQPQPPAELSPVPPTAQAPAGLVVKVHLQNGRVLWAEAVNGKTIHVEGVSDVVALTWLGLPEAEALAQVRAAGRGVRVVARDDEHFAVTLDYNPDRLNLHVRQGVVVAITTG